VWHRNELIVQILCHANLDEQVWCDLPVALEDMKSEIHDTLLLHDGVDFLKEIPKVKGIKLCQLVELLMRNDDQLCLSLPVEIKVCETPLVIQMGIGCVLLFTRRTVSLSIVVTWGTRRVLLDRHFLYTEVMGEIPFNTFSFFFPHIII